MKAEVVGRDINSFVTGRCEQLFQRRKLQIQNSFWKDLVITTLVGKAQGM